MWNRWSRWLTRAGDGGGAAAEAEHAEPPLAPSADCGQGSAGVSTSGDAPESVWTYAVEGEWPMAHQVRLRPDGAIWGLWGVPEVGWALVDGRLAFLDASDVRRVVFDEGVIGPDGRKVLTGRLLDGGGARTLRQTEPINRLCPAALGPEIKSRSGPRRRNLLVLRAGDRSLHSTWPRDIPDEDRSWDLCISGFGDPAVLEREPDVEHTAMQPGERKFEALYRLFHEESPLWAYDYVGFADDDMMISWKGWNTLFAVCRRFDLDLAQPAIDGYPNQPITRPNPDYLLRYVSWVEVMAPVLSNRALRLCMPVLEGSRSGYGLDHIWPKLLGEPQDRIAVIDAVVATHTRPGLAATQTYDYQAALREGGEVQGRYGAPWRTVEFGGIRREPLDRHEDW